MLPLEKSLAEKKPPSRIMLSALLLFLSTTGLLSPPAGASDVGAFVKYGHLFVCGTSICPSYSLNPIQLRGISTHGLQWYGEQSTAGANACVTRESIRVLADEWKIDVLRISMYPDEGPYKTDKANYHQSVSRIIDWATEEGLYVIVDWHMLVPGDPFDNIEHAKTYFDYILDHHGDQRNLIFEIANEPNRKASATEDYPYPIDWNRLYEYAEEMLTFLRARTENVVLMGTPDWASFGLSGTDAIDAIKAKPLPTSSWGRNTMYTFHFYAASHQDWYFDNLSTRVFGQLPVFVSEFGLQDAAGEGANDLAMSERWLDQLGAHRIGWVNWNFSDDHRSGAVFRPGTCAAGDFANPALLKEAGAWIKDRLASNYDGDYAWSNSVTYSHGEVVVYEGRRYRVVHAVAAAGWGPPDSPVLWAVWQDIGPAS